MLHREATVIDMTTTNTRFGVQPIQGILRARQISVADAALQIAVRQTHLYNAITGRIHPNAEVRDRLPKLLGLPINQLFTHDALYEPDQRAFNNQMRKTCGCVCEVHS